MLPVLEIQHEILTHLARSNRLVLTAPTGSGKSTQVPRMLLEGQPTGQIVVLQPRRLAARLLARRVAQELGEPVGETVGYQTRHDSRVGETTRIVYMTEGLFLRRLHTDPALTGVAAVVLDEFHERSLAADMALGAVARLQTAQRPDLRLIVMSATLDAGAVSAYLSCGTLTAGGRLFPVAVSYLPRRSDRPVWEQAAQAVAALVARGEEGDVLVFMPGVYEIRRTLEACRRALPDEDVALLALHGSLPAEQQDAALAPADRRKVVVSTNVAETSITIEGVRHVIDSGLARVHRFDARRGINVLRIEPISQASAAQRAGRAGRTAPGTCLRLWPEPEHRTRPAHDTPEIRRLDLAEPTLQLAAMGEGVRGIRSFQWLEPPEEQAVDRAAALLRALGALDERGRLTPRGRRMARFPMHPRLSRMLLEAAERRCLERAVLWATLISERDILTGPVPAALRELEEGEPASDLAVLERVFEAARAARFDVGRCAQIHAHAHACRELDRTHRQLLSLCRRAGLPMETRGGTADLIQCLLVAYPDHVAMCSDTHPRRCTMVNQKRVVLDPASVVGQAGPVLALDVRETGEGDRLRTVLSLASELDPAWLAAAHPDRLRTERHLAWNEQKQAVEAIEQREFAGLVLERTARPTKDPAAADVLVSRILAGELTLPRWDEAVEQWIARARCVAEWFPQRGLIRYDEEDRGVILHEVVAGAARFSEVRDRPCLPVVRGVLSWDDQQFVERMAPADLRLPGGRRMKLAYQPGHPPRGRAKIQDLFGLADTPRVAGGRQKVLLEVLAPNFRPVQVTDDLAGFWQNLYPSVKRELSRRYPRHEWREV